MSPGTNLPTSVPLAWCPSANVTVNFVAVPTTWAFVTMSPFVSTTKPEPSDCVCSAPPKKLFVDAPVTVISTTPGVTSL